MINTPTCLESTVNDPRRPLMLSLAISATYNTIVVLMPPPLDKLFEIILILHDDVDIKYTNQCNR